MAIQELPKTAVGIQRALVSVSDKTGVVAFCKALVERGVEILSTGGTAAVLAQAGIAVTQVSTYTGFPEIMGGRLKTLHPRIHGALLGRRAQDADVMAKQGIEPIDLLVVNLYPFERTIAEPGCALSDAIENIDVGGPAMIRAGAKNYAAVTVVVDPGDYQGIVEEMAAHNGGVAAETRFSLAAKAFAHTARYDGIISNYLSALGKDGSRGLFPQSLTLQYAKIQDMRYGENPHQQAAFYADQAIAGASMAAVQQLQGKSLSYNNVADADAALACVKAFSEPACVIVKHGNPCGVAIAEGILAAYERAFQTDPTSAFGGIIAFNRQLDRATAQAVIQRQFVEVVVSPAVAEEALPVLATKQNVRVLACGNWAGASDEGWEFKRVIGGLLVQDRDAGSVSTGALRVVTVRQPTAQEQRDLMFAWQVVKFVKSNAIVYCRDGMTIGIGAGQMSRVYSARIAAIKAADEDLSVSGSVMASDAFLPFRDGIDAAAKAGVSAVVQPGGSVRDEEVIAAADEHGMAMVFTGMRHFRH